MGTQESLEIQIPDDTLSSALKLFSKKNKYIMVGDHLHHFLEKINAQILDPSLVSNPQSSLRLSLITAFQFVESYSDFQASEAILKRIDWKYALFLPLTHPGISQLNLSQFRQIIFSSSAALEEYNKFLSELHKLGFFNGLTIHSPNARTLISRICQLTRVNLLRSTMKAALGVIVSLEPDWLIGQLSPHWFERYRSDNSEFYQPLSDDEISSIAEKVGCDIFSLLTSLRSLNSLKVINHPAIQKLNYLFQQQFYFIDEIIYWRIPDCINCICIDSFQEGGLK